MIINEVAGSGGDAMPWLFHQEESGNAGWQADLGAGLVGIGAIPVLMGRRHSDLAELRIFLSHPRGKWQDREPRHRSGMSWSSRIRRL